MDARPYRCNIELNRHPSPPGLGRCPSGHKVSRGRAWGAGRAAIAAFARFGKRRRAAALNLGDGFASARARALDAPLLCEGSDFPQTDIRIA